MPSAKSCRPPIIRKIETMEGQPDVGSPNKAARTTMKMRAMNAPMKLVMPTIETNVSGASEKSMIPSVA